MLQAKLFSTMAAGQQGTVIRSQSKAGPWAGAVPPKAIMQHITTSMVVVLEAPSLPTPTAGSTNRIVNGSGSGHGVGNRTEIETQIFVRKGLLSTAVLTEWRHPDMASSAEAALGGSLELVRAFQTTQIFHMGVLQLRRGLRPSAGYIAASHRCLDLHQRVQHFRNRIKLSHSD
jgi:hypothetical protein